MADSPITVLIVDDERLARERLRVLLEGEPSVQISGECENGLEALEVISRVHPQLVFLDVQMPDLDGLGVIEALGADNTPEIIFVTAHDTYMERAFELHAVDYLRKPYTNARFFSALSEARKRIRAKGINGGEGLVAGGEASPSRYATVLSTVHRTPGHGRLALEDGESGTWHLVDKHAIDWIHADGAAGVRVHVGKESYLWKKTLSEIQQTLDSGAFLRVHRSYIVNAGRIRHVKPLQKGEFAVILDDGTMLDTGRTYREVIEDFLKKRG